MPTYRIPASLYIEAEDVHAAIQTATTYLDEASYRLANDGFDRTWGTITAVDVETHQAEECPPIPADD